MDLGVGDAVEVFARGGVGVQTRRILVPVRMVEGLVGSGGAIHGALSLVCNLRHTLYSSVRRSCCPLDRSIFDVGWNRMDLNKFPVLQRLCGTECPKLPDVGDFPDR